MKHQFSSFFPLSKAASATSKGSSSQNGFTLPTRQGFTLIELLVVIAIIAILAVTVVLTLNPGQLIMQGRDSTRIQDFATLQDAIGLYITDLSINGSVNLGVASTVYVSIPDPVATSSAGDQCQGLSLISLPSGYSYHCASTSTYRNIDSTGWIPINFTKMTSGPAVGQLPTDPLNTSSSRNYDTYMTNGTQYELTTSLESSKYKLGGSNDLIGSDGSTLSTVYTKGTNLSLEPLDYGDQSLVGYWTFDEGANSTAYDYSGNNATGSLSSPAPTWVTGKVGSGALSFNGSSNYVGLGNPGNLNITSAGTVSAWVYRTASNGYQVIAGKGNFGSGLNGYILGIRDINVLDVLIGNASTYNELVTGTLVPQNAWAHVAFTWDGFNIRAYMNGSLIGSRVQSINATPAVSNGAIGADSGVASFLVGTIDDVHIYNRALSAAEIQAMYQGGK